MSALQIVITISSVLVCFMAYIPIWGGAKKLFLNTILVYFLGVVLLNFAWSFCIEIKNMNDIDDLMINMLNIWDFVMVNFILSSAVIFYNEKKALQGIGLVGLFIFTILQFTELDILKYQVGFDLINLIYFSFIGAVSLSRWIVRDPADDLLKIPELYFLFGIFVYYSLRLCFDTLGLAINENGSEGVVAFNKEYPVASFLRLIFIGLFVVSLVVYNKNKGTVYLYLNSKFKTKYM